MKKNFKLIITLIIAIFIGVNITQARSCDDILMYKHDYSKTEIYVHSPELSYYGYNYGHWELGDSEAMFASFCRNPGKHSGFGTGANFVCKEVVFDSDDPHTKQVYDAGVIEILRNGYSVENRSGGEQEFVATAVAIRAYEKLWPDIDTNGKDAWNDPGYKVYLDMFNYVAKDLVDGSSEIKGLIAELRTKGNNIQIPPCNMGVNCSTVNSFTSGSGRSGINITDAIYGEARRLMSLGLKAALDFEENGSASVNYNADGVDMGSSSKRNEDGTITYKKAIGYTFNIEKFDSSDSYVKLEFDCPSCVKYGMDYEFFINDESVGKSLPNNLVDYVQGGTGKINLKIEFTGNSASYNCQKLDYKLKLRYFDDTIKTEAYDMQYASSANKAYIYQEFYVLYADNVEQTDEIPAPSTFRLCKPSCKDVEKSCKEEKDPEACEDYEKEYNSTCVECTTFVSDATCSPDASNVNIKEGYELGENVCESPETLNVLSCVINQSDKAGNSFEAKNIINNNDYCSVFCKEDYHIELPGDKEVNSGRYFSLKASISGTKTCYSNKIDKDKFETDFENARRNVVTAYNAYQFYNSVVNQIEGGATDIPGKDYKHYSYSWSVKAFEPSGNGGTLTSTNTLPSISNTTCTSSSGGASCTYSSDGTDIADYSSKFGEAKNSLNAAISKLETIVKNYNSCSDWVMDYNFDPEITFDYEEEYMDIALTDKLQTTGDIKKSDVAIQRCAGDIDNAYNTCSTGWSNDKLMESREVFTCHESDNTYACESVTMSVSKATRIKEEIKSNGEYITPTQFFTVYPNGSIVTSEKEVEGANPLENKLPVGLNTPRGRYSYSLKVNNLGEFYDSDELGRIWGNDNSVVDAAIKDESVCERDGALKTEAQIGDNTITDGVYVCEYTVNCPNCPVVCEGDNCWYDDDDCPNGKCPVVCEGCLYDSNDGANVTYRPITSNDLNPNNRDLGANWEYDDNIDSALELKAYTTTSEIEESGENVYEDSQVMKVTLNSALIKKIRDYNASQKDNGGYANNTLKCYSHKNSNDGKTYDNVYCYSTFIDELLNDSSLSKNIEIDSRRLLNENERKTNTQQSGYWTAWSDATSKWNVSTELGIQFRSNYENVGVGPSWK